MQALTVLVSWDSIMHFLRSRIISKNLQVLLHTSPYVITNAFGHYIPFIQLGRRLHSRDIRISMTVPSDILAELRSKGVLTPDDELHVFHVIDVDSLSMQITSSHGSQLTIAQTLTKMMESQSPPAPGSSTSGPPKNIMQGLQMKLAGILPGLKSYLSNISNVDLVIIDYYVSPAAEVLADRQIPYCVFNTGAPLMALSLLTLTASTPTDDAAGPSPMLDDFRNKAAMPAAFKEMTLERKVILGKARGFILNSFAGLADELVRDVQSDKYSLAGLNIFQIGPLFPEEEGTSTKEDQSGQKIIQWLDESAPHSVIYVSFGTVATPSPPQLTALCNTLLTLITRHHSRILWSLPVSHHSYVADTLRTHPSVLLTSWTPQRLVLGHPALALFVSHCGWNSTLESLAMGVPVVGWPLFSDQYLNSQWLEDAGLGLRVRGTGLMGPTVRVVPEEEIVGIISRILDGREEFAAAVGEWKKKIADAMRKPSGSYYSEFDRLSADVLAI
ncbi:uncharacterized protein LOC129585570 isoform X2 [Paramacrobiotus metropolitanus]|uniref:uncharacterized protein LOC129585570 isoform X2 n=1 Tax=Paramacrobiotus metropolitanus TaxID=2943436 RepID=UPI0024458CD7|nr:uncharacterized protein LOC129585570 isoform X2 [Paramacrobiotus metropolitanus]